MSKNLILLLLLTSFLSFSQIKGKITDTYGNPIPYVSVLVEGTYNGTSSNENGLYQLDITSSGNYQIIYRSLAYKTQKISVSVNNFPFVQDVVLEDEAYLVEEVMISSSENPANGIIRNAIKNKKENSDKMDKYTADFYSKGMFKIKDLPEKILGQKIDLEGMEAGLDSTRSGILYLSETMSKITVQKPNKIKERILASKISGDDRGFSYNTAEGTQFDFYENYIDFGTQMISPIADNAFNYYKYKIDNSFYDERENLIFKIQVTSKRDKEPVFEGFIYIVDNTYAVYGVDFDIKGYRMNQPFLDNLKLIQNYSYDPTKDKWTKNLQTLDFEAGAFGMKFNGMYTRFSNYEFVDSFEKKTFTREIISFDKEANKKDDSFWNDFRPVPLTDEEITDYVRKDSIQTVRKSKVYMDSLDRKSNKFEALDILLGYTYKNSYKKWRISYDGISDIASTSYNTVQGWNFNTGIRYFKENEEKGTYTSIGSRFNYGISEDRLRVNGWINHQFNRYNNATVAISGGSRVRQFNDNVPISPFINMVSTLFFKDNYMKLFNEEFARVAYGQEVINGLYMSGAVEYSNRRALFNTTNYVIFNKSGKEYLSNNPLNPNDDTVAAFDKHDIYKADLGVRIRFGQEYISRPDAKWNVVNENYPSLFLNYQKGFAASDSDLNYDLLMARVYHTKTFGNKGTMGAHIKAGKFFGADDISFIDYKHFNGNQTHVATSSWYLNQFHLLPYYSHSTNDSYVEMHFEHQFGGYIMNKIPLLNKLQWHLNVGYHNISIPEMKPYNEFSVGFDNIGFGKFRMIRFDYVRAYNGSSFSTDGIMIGLKFLNMF